MMLKLLSILLLSLALVGCYQTERQQYGYATSDLIVHAEELKQQATPAQYAPIALARARYSQATTPKAMRAALDALNEAERALDASLGGFQP